jgi:hypothetical protein
MNTRSFSESVIEQAALAWLGLSARHAKLAAGAAATLAVFLFETHKANSL